MVDELNFSAYIIGIMGVKYYIRSDFMIQGLKEKLEVLKNQSELLLFSRKKFQPEGLHCIFLGQKDVRIL